VKRTSNVLQNAKVQQRKSDTVTTVKLLKLEIAIASEHESLVKALAWQTGNRFSPRGREL
jgi:hypothetical protein